MLMGFAAVWFYSLSLILMIAVWECTIKETGSRVLAALAYGITLNIACRLYPVFKGFVLSW
jgi:hypothetical protein